MTPLLELLLRHTKGNIEIRRMVWRGRKGKDGEGQYKDAGRTFRRDPDQLADFTSGADGDYFHGVNSRRPGAATGQKQDILEITGVFVDVDFKKVPPEVVEAKLKEFEFRPTALINSGNGRHIYWLFKTPILINGSVNPINNAEGIGLGLANFFGSDHVQNIDRILRTPGFVNSKWSNRPVCRELFVDGPWYEIDDLMGYWTESLLKVEDRITLGEIPDKLPAKFQEVLDSDKKVRLTWEGKRDDLKDASRSGYDMSMASLLSWREFSAEEIACVLILMKPGKGSDGTLAYLEYTISKAKESVDATTKETTDKPLRTTQAERLLELAQDVTLFHDEVMDTYGAIQVGDHRETWPCKGKSFRRYLAYEFYKQYGKPPGSEALKGVVQVLEGKAVFDGDEFPLHNRVAWYDRAIWYDLSDSKWRAVKVTSKGYEVVPDPPILFRRYSHQSPQVDPVAYGDMSLLNNYLNVKPEDLKMIKVALCTCFIPDISHPIVHPYGEKGAGKTFVDYVFRGVVDPSQVPILSFPRDHANLAQQLAHHYCPRYDNVSRIHPWISDVLCRAVSGEGFTKRELYSDDEDIIYKFRRCIGLNGINVAATATDLMDRVILVEMDRIEGTKRKEELRLWDDFERDKPKILGAIFGLVSKAMGIKGSLVISELPRMADFAVWGEAIWRAMGEKDGGFLDLYAKNLEAKNQEVVSGTPVAAAIVELMDSKPEWQGPATSLLEALETAAKELKLDTDAKSWPKAPHILTRRLKEVISNLREIGLQITFMVVGKAKVISITKVGKNSGGSE